MPKQAPAKPRRPSLPLSLPLRLPRLLLVPPLLTLLLLLSLPHLPPVRTPFSPPPPPSHPSPQHATTPPLPPDHCLLLGANPLNPTLWSAGSRALCLVPNLCLPTQVSPHLFRLAARPTTCHLLTPDFRPPSPPAARPTLHRRLRAEFASCHAFQRRTVSCAYGMHYRLNRPVCPLEHVVWPPADTPDALPHPANLSLLGGHPAAHRPRWVHEQLVVLLPEYPYQRNIFHYTNVVPWMASVIHSLDLLLDEWQRAADSLAATAAATAPPVWSDGEKRVRVLVRGRRDRNAWQQGLWDAVWAGWVARTAWRVNVTWLGDEYGADDATVVCGKRVVMLGRYGDINAWPFVNASQVPPGGWHVPVAAVRLKQAVYREMGVAGVWEREPKGDGEGDGEGGVMRAVPMVVGYARRMGRDALEGEGGGSLSGNVKAGSTERVFTREDEEWFGAMLREEVGRRGVELREFMAVPSETFGQQVRRMAGVGLVVGIHGANLVNGLWVRPWGGLVEVFPYGAASRCYWGGMNGGLRYWSWEAGESFDAFRCDERKLECRLQLRNRNVYLGKEGDRDGVRAMVAHAVDWLKAVHGDGKGVRVRREGDVYVRQP